MNWLKPQPDRKRDRLKFSIENGNSTLGLKPELGVRLFRPRHARGYALVRLAAVANPRSRSALTALGGTSIKNDLAQGFKAVSTIRSEPGGNYRSLMPAHRAVRGSARSCRGPHPYADC